MKEMTNLTSQLIARIIIFLYKSIDEFVIKRATEARSRNAQRRQIISSLETTPEKLGIKHEEFTSTKSG